MTIAETLLPEFDQEMKTTRKVLERVPTDKGKWKPHEKSFSIGHLAQLLSWMPDWITNTLTQDSLDLATAAKYSYETTETLLAEFDRHVSEARAAIAGVKGFRLRQAVVAQDGRPGLSDAAARGDDATTHQSSRPSPRADERLSPASRHSSSILLRTDS